jgi:choline dehydrogenase
MASDGLHGGGGELRVERQRARYPILDAYAEACRQAGLPQRDDFYDGDNEGVGYFEVNQRGGFRWNAARAFLRPARGRRNLEIRTGAEVARLLVERRPEGLACGGVELVGGGRILARRGVGLAAGAVNSPKLLQLSGLGPGALLAGHGIEVLADLPAVGGNLQDHLQLRTVWKVTAGGTLNEIAGTWRGKAGIALEYALRRTGPMSAAPSQLGAFTRSSPGRNHPNIEFHVQPLSLDAFGEPLHAFPAITASVCDLNPTSRGRVDIASPRPADAPSIRPNYLSTQEDLKVAADSLRVTRGICSQRALERYAPVEWRPGAGCQTDEELAAAAAEVGSTIFHPVGTTAMGRDGDPDAVLDARMRMRDGKGGLVKGLRVVDAGAMPAIVSGNTNAPVLMMAEKAARWIREGD